MIAIAAESGEIGSIPMSAAEMAAAGGTENRSGYEPWMRGTHADLPVVPRAVLHALELAREDVERWCVHLTDEEWNLCPPDSPSTAFHVRHMVRSMDRLLMYAESERLSGLQLEMLNGEMSWATGDEVMREFRTALAKAEKRVRALGSADLEAKRVLGRKALPTSVGGLLVHVAEHTARHTGQAISTAKLAMAGRGSF